MLMRCSECGHEVSDKASACPFCGAPVIGAPATVTPPTGAGGEAVPTDGQCATARQDPVRRKGMVRCSKCGYEYSFDAERCPKCGNLNCVRLAMLYICIGVVLLIAFCIYMVMGLS